MSIVSDQDFGELHFDGVWKGICEMVFMGRRLEVELVVQTFDAAPISEVQRLAYREFNLNKGSISSLVEEAVFNYYLGRLCSGQPIPDSGLSFSSATAGGNPSLN